MNDYLTKKIKDGHDTATRCYKAERWFEGWVNHVVSNLPIALKVLCAIQSVNFLYPSIMVGMILKSQNAFLSLRKWKL